MNTQQPDTRPGPYYVSCIRGGKTYPMAGPYQDHASALADVEKAREAGYAADPRTWFDAWGTIRIEGCDRIGRLNQLNLM